MTGQSPAMVIALLAVLALAGCGGGSPKVYSGQTILAHIRAEAAFTKTDVAGDPYGQQAAASTLFKLSDGEYGVVYVMDTIAEAKSTVRDAPQMLVATGLRSAHGERHGNVVIIWANKPPGKTGDSFVNSIIGG